MIKFDRKGSKWHMLPVGESGFRTIIRVYEKNSKRKNIPFELDVETFRKLITSNCYYCGCPPSNVAKKETDRSKFAYNGLDRIDPKKGYVEGNVLPCCKRDNYIRNVYLTVEETKVVVMALEEFKKKPKVLT